jgi:L-ascorbate oxidase
MCLLLNFLVFAIAAGADATQVSRSYDLVVSKGAFLPDGYSVLTYSVNGIFPGPAIAASVGDRLLINVTNQMFMHETLTMHWHGISQFSSQWADGTASVTNCPIPYGSSFLYNFTVERSGTFWYHTHAGETRIKGAYGLLIVEDTDPSTVTYTYDAEQHLILGDWYHGATTDIDAGMMSKPFTWAGNGNSVLLNGKGVCKECNLTGSTYATTTTYSDAQWPPVSTKISCKGKRETLFVHANKTYLVRVLNAASLAFFNFAIAGHSLTLVAADGHAVQQMALSSIDICPGCRIDVLVTANQQPPLPEGSTESYTFSMRAQTDWRGADNTPAGVGWGYWTYIAPDKNTGVVTAISSEVPPNESREWNEWNSLIRGEVSSASYHSPPPNAEVTKRLVVTLQQEYVNKHTGQGYTPPLGVASPSSSVTSDMILAWTLNGVRWNMPSTPYLLNRYLHTLEGTPFVTDGSTPYRLELGDVVDLTIQNSVAGNGVCEQHPWHLHGIHFWLVGHGEGQFTSEAESSYDTVAPPLLDTVTGYPSNYSNRRGDASSPATHIPGTWQAPCGWVTLRMKVTNPGMWLFHCHIAWHTEMGMSLVFDAASELVTTKYPSDMGLCGTAPERVAALSDSSDEDPKNDDDKSEELSRGALIGITISVTFVVTAGLLAALLFFWKRLQGTGSRHRQDSYDAEERSSLPLRTQPPRRAAGEE